MAVRELKNPEGIKMNVVMKDGREFLGCDSPPTPLCENDGLAVAFWHEGALRIVPLQDVLHVDFYTDESE